MVNDALIPLAAILVSAAFGAVAIVWDSERRATRPMAAVFLCTGCWALVDLCAFLEPDAARARALMRFTHVPPLMIGPSTLWVVSEMLPRQPPRVAMHARIGAVVCLAVGLASVFAPGNIEAMIPTDHGGWIPVYGTFSIVLIPLGTILPAYAAFVAHRTKRDASAATLDRRRVWAVELCVLLSLGMVAATEWALPLLEIPVPRLGALSVSLASALLWLNVLHAADDLAVTPQGMARAVLAELQDGVVLVEPDGLILSVNSRFLQLAERRRSDLVGESIGDLLKAPIERICEGVEDRKTVIRLPGGRTVPISVSSSLVRNRSQGVIGVVVVCRDLRDVDTLRNRLLGSGRLAAIGELAAGIAHEVNNPVAFIRSDLNLLRERIEELRAQVVAVGRPKEDRMIFDRSRVRVANALASIDRVTEVVRDVREFAHVGGAGQGGSNPESVVRGAMRLAQLERQDEVEFSFRGNASIARIDSGQELKQVMLTLMRMLVTASAEGGLVEVDLQSDEKELVIGLSAAPLAGDSSDFLARFELSGEHAFEGSAEEVGLGIAVDLVAQMEGRLGVEAVGDAALRLEVAIPLDHEADSA